MGAAHKFYNFTNRLCIIVLINILRQNLIVMVNTKNRELESGDPVKVTLTAGEQVTILRKI